MNDELIRIRLFGGLGNQLFQFTAGASLANSRNCKLLIDKSWLNSTTSHPNSSLDAYQFTDSKAIAWTNNRSNTLWNTNLGNSLVRKLQIPSNFTKIHNPLEVGYVELSHLPQSIELRGYYQSYRYFDDLKKTGNLPNFDLKNSSILPLEEDFIGIHIRGGDYLNAKSGMYQLGSEYYARSIAKARMDFPNLPIIVFTNDERFASVMLDSIIGLQYRFFPNANFSAAHVVSQFSKGTVIIGANSTFSYWAGMLSRSSELKIFPNEWFRNNRRPKFLYPPDWKIV